MGKLPKFMILTVVIAGAAPLFITGPNGAPLAAIDGLDLSKLNQFDFSKPQAMITGGDNNISGSLPSAKGATSFYQWKDEIGSSQFTLMPPQDPSIDFKVVTIDPNQNVIQSMSKAEIASALGWNTEKPPTSSANSTDMPSLPSLLPSTIPADQIPKLIEQAKATQSLMDERSKMLDSL